MLNYSFQYLSNMINRSLLILSFISIVVLNSCNNAKTKNNASEIEQGSIEIENVDFPYFETEFFNVDQFKKLFDTSSVSPAFYGNIMTFYAAKK